MNLFSDAGQHTFAVTSPALQIRCLSNRVLPDLPRYSACRLPRFRDTGDFP
jgi:hypothetical protein